MTLLSIFSGLPFVGFLTNLPDVVKRWLVLALVAASSFALGHVHGLYTEQLKNAERETQRVEYILKVERKAQAVVDKHQAATVIEKEKIRVVYKTIDTGVDRYVQVSEVARSPVIDTDFGLLYNASALGCSPTEPACRADASIPTNTTPGEVLAASVSAHKLYHECQVTVAGWQKFYQELQETYNVDQ